MHGKKFAAVAVAGCLGALVVGSAANAAEITVVASGGPLPDVMGTLVPMFESATGNRVKISFKGEGAIATDLKQGAADLVITNTEVVDELATAGEVAANGKTLLMISKVAVAVKAGAPKPDISTPEKFKAALMAAKTVGYSQGSSGRHVADRDSEARYRECRQGQGRYRARPSGRCRHSVRRSRDRHAAGCRAAADPGHRRDRRIAGRPAKANPDFRRHRR